MKKLISIMVIIIAAVSFLVVGNTRAEAMNNESAAVLTAGMVLMGIPVMHAIVQEAVHHERAYGHAYTPPRYIERTKIVYAEPRHERMQRYRQRDHDRDSRYGWDCRRDGRGHEDSHRGSGRQNNNPRRK